MPERDAISVATSTRDGKPSTRMVLLRHVDDHSVGWFTNYESRKGHELEENPFAAILWYCETRGRQVRMEGPVEKMTPRESDDYFATRARGSQLGAHASAQSSVIASREELERTCERVGRSSTSVAIFRDRTTGEAIASRRIGSSSGNIARADCTTASCTTSTPNGWTLERQAP